MFSISVICFNIEKYSADENIIFVIKSYDDNYYICTTCDKALRNNSVPCQAVANRLNVVELSKSFQDIRRLEKFLVPRRVLFKKVTVMPKGKSLKIKGSICNISVSEVVVTGNMLPRPTDSNCFIIVKLKRKLECKGHVVFEAVRPDIVIQFLEFLRSHNRLYSNIKIIPTDIPVDILGLQRLKTEEDARYSKLQKCLNEPTEVQLELSLGEETLEDPLSEFRTASMETTFVSEIPSACEMEEDIVFASGKGKKPVLMTSFARSLVIHICFVLVIVATKLKGKFQ